MPVVTLYLDDRKTRDLKPAPAAPLKLRVYVDRHNVKHYKTKIEVTADQFEKSYLSKNPRGENLALKTKIEAIKVKADNIVDTLGDNFTFERFKLLLYKRSYDKGDLGAYLNEYVQELYNADRVGTAQLYELALKSLLKFKGKDKPADSIRFREVTVKFLNDYENWFVKDTDNNRVKSLTTVGMYLRNIRVIFNLAIKRGDITHDVYPFGKGKYVIPTGSNTKKSIGNDVLKMLYEKDLSDKNLSHLKGARDYWFFSFQCNGMNPKDIASLKYKDISDNSFSFRREKTKRTIKAKNVAPIMVPITDSIRAFINEYGNKDKHPDNYVFPIFKKGMSELDKAQATNNFVQFINNNMKRLTKLMGINIKITSLAARHSFTTKVTKAVGLEFAQEALGHTSLNTTQNYWAGFESETKRDVASKLLDFD